MRFRKYPETNPELSLWGVFCVTKHSPLF